MQIRWITGGIRMTASRGDVYLLGRTTYEMLWPFWSTQTTGDGPGPILNRMKKYVVSTTLETAPWKESTIIRGNVVEELTTLKQQPGNDIILDGSASLVQSLMGTDLIIVDNIQVPVEKIAPPGGRQGMTVITELVSTNNDQDLLKRRRSWYWLALLLFVISLFSRQPLLFLAALFTLLVALVPDLWYRNAFRHIVVRQYVNHHNVFFGEEVTLSVSFENHKFLPLPWLKVENKIAPSPTIVSKKTSRLQNARREALTGIWLLWSYQQVTRQYRIHCQERGFHRFGPISLSSSDPFGWLEREGMVPAIESLVVYPLIAPLEALGLSSIHPLGEHVTARRLLEDPLRVAGVRDYLLGDDPRRIHWKATARAGTLRSKVYETPALRQLLLLLDVWNYSEAAGGPDLEIQELTIATSASLGVWALDEGYMVGLLANSSMVMPLSGQALSMSMPAHESDTIQVDREDFSASVLSPANTSIPFSSDDGQYERLLSTLGRLFPQSSGSIGTLMDMEESMFPFGTTAVLVSATNSLDEGTIERLLDLRLRGTAVHLVLTGNPDAGETLETYDFPVHYVGGKEKWHELIRTVDNDKNGAVGTSSSILRLD